VFQVYNTKNHFPFFRGWGPAHSAPPARPLPALAHGGQDVPRCELTGDLQLARPLLRRGCRRGPDQGCPSPGQRGSPQVTPRPQPLAFSSIGAKCFTSALCPATSSPHSPAPSLVCCEVSHGGGGDPGFPLNLPESPSPSPSLGIWLGLLTCPPVLGLRTPGGWGRAPESLLSLWEALPGLIVSTAPVWQSLQVFPLPLCPEAKPARSQLLHKRKWLGRARTQTQGPR
jgi:hypothetical protein